MIEKSIASVKNTRDIIQRKQERDPIVVNNKTVKQDKTINDKYNLGPLNIQFPNYLKLLRT